jgi:hypothetical protein
MMGRMHRAKTHPARAVARSGAAALTMFIILMAVGCGGDSSSPPLATPVPTPTPIPTPTRAPGGSFAPLGSTPTMN